MFLVLSCSCPCPNHWSQVFSPEWKCKSSSADRRSPNHIWMINNIIANEGTSYIRGLMVLHILSRLTLYIVHIDFTAMRLFCFINHVYRAPSNNNYMVQQTTWHSPYMDKPTFANYKSVLHHQHGGPVSVTRAENRQCKCPKLCSQRFFGLRMPGELSPIEAVDAYTHQKTRPSLVLTMACRLFCANAFSEPTLS